MAGRSKISRVLKTSARWFAVLIVAAIAALLLLEELRTSRVQAVLFSWLAGRMSYELGDGPARFPLASPSGPYDIRLGYASLPKFGRGLEKKHFAIAEQARVSGAMHLLKDLGVFPIYHEKTVAGLDIRDRDDRQVYSRGYPVSVFLVFSAIPPEIVRILLFLENRELLDPARPFLNPAVEWDRLGRAILDKGMQILEPEQSVPGGSTLATQIEKFRHSEAGITHSPAEKLRQMVSASLRCYQDGPRTVETRKRIVLDYLNSVPLAARPNYGEIIGLGDGLWAWYGAELDDVTRAFFAKPGPTAENLGDKALALKQVLSLFVAHKRPTDYLLRNPGSLGRQCDGHLSLLARDGFISSRMEELAAAAPLHIRPGPLPGPPMTLVERKAANAVRTRLLSLLSVDKLYVLDRLDLVVRSTLDLTAQTAITQQILALHDPEWVAGHALLGFRLLEKGNVAKVIYSVTLYEKTPRGNVLRVQTDNYDQALNINEGVKLDLGSTAKLRALITYLEVIASLHELYGGMSPEELRKVVASPKDRLGQWAVAYLIENDDRGLLPMLRAAMDRKYSASPFERFYTGGGLHRFENFDREDDAKVMSVRAGFQNSVNLVFIRLMRDVVFNFIYGENGGMGRLLADQDDPRRREYLERFADFEGSKFVRMFFRKYSEKSSDEALETLLSSVRPAPFRVVAAYRSVAPDNDYPAFVEFVKSRLPESGVDRKITPSMFKKYSPDNYSLSDRGYLARIHPLELWVVAYLQDHPNAKLNEVMEASASARQEVYHWLFRTSRKGAQDKRIRILLEIEAFQRIHESWRRLGYPFDSLVPSFATAIGSSGDRPASLTALMGIILSDGVSLPTYRIEQLHFAKGTPYEVRFERKPEEGERVLPVEIAEVVREALYGVVENGTAVRARRCLSMPDGTPIRVGGKTGTGDNRYETFGWHGRLVTSRVVNRTSVFAFIVGDRFFGTIAAYVPGPEAAAYGFTSSLPVAILKLLGPQLLPMITRPPETSKGLPD